MEPSFFELNNFTYSDPSQSFNIQIKKNEIHSLMIKDSSEQELFIEQLQYIHRNRKNVFFQGEEVNPPPNGLDIGHHTSIEFLHRSPLTSDNLTVAENVNLMHLPRYPFLPFLNWNKIYKNTVDLFNRLNLDYDPKEKLYRLSAEDKKFIYLCRVLILNPSFLILHEPTENLSSKNAIKMFNILQQFKEERGSLLLITKQWEDALKIGDHISILNNGELTGQMSASEAKADPQMFLKRIEGYNFQNQDQMSEDGKSFLNSVFKAAEFLTSEYELKDVLLLLAKEVNKFMHADGCAIQLLDEDTWNTIDKFEYQDNSSINVQLKKDTILKIAKSNEIFYINQKDKEFDILFEKNDKVRTFICIPVLIRSQVTGLISIYYEDYYVYSKEESQYLSALAKHVAIAIEDTRLMGRSTLLQESHHRIKNNLQSIIGLITLQKAVYKQDKRRSIDELLDNVIHRIKSIAAVHDLLSKDRMGRSIINLKDLVESIIEVSSATPDISTSLRLEDVFIPYNKATSIALIINELVINCHKHAFNHQDSGHIWIHSYKDNDYITLSVSDDGIGLPSDFDIKKSDSLGLTIIKGILQSELHGSLKLEESSVGGSAFTIMIPTKHLFAT